MGWYEEHIDAQARLDERLARIRAQQDEAWATMARNVKARSEEHEQRLAALAARAGNPVPASPPKVEGPRQEDSPCPSNHPFSKVAGERYPCMRWPFEPHRSQGEGALEAAYAAQWKKDHKRGRHLDIAV